MDLAAPNQSLLDAIERQGLWRRARSTRPIWAKQVDEPCEVVTLEARETVPAGAYLCRGEAGDVWPQTALRLHAKYVPSPEPGNDGWRKYIPRADNPGVWAAQIAEPFQVHTKWGVLQGQPGDFIVRDVEPPPGANAAEPWIVAARLFAKFYVWLPNESA